MSNDIFNLEDLEQDSLLILLYGIPGIGKTTVLGNLKGKTLIIDVDKGTNVLSKKDYLTDEQRKNIKVKRLKEDLSDLVPLLQELEKQNPYDNICLDTVTELEKSMLTVYGRLGKNDGAPELSHYNKVGFKIVDYCRRLRSLKSNIILTSWEAQKEYIAPDGTKYTQAVPMFSGKTADNIMGLCDIVGRVEISTKEETEGKRYIRLSSSPIAVAKDKLDHRRYCEIQDLIIK